ncbi:tyrosine-type recombinase/integrase [Enterococcus avium]|uniref:Tyrosine-type recombinase/integrase n=1 Tax=Enterococcus avium TaxID=33945 RepID=A0AAW8RWC7_ENTAV|nr:tyrosine-type recombinase/integrase [Enterococcus avium]MDT2402499.1 tyrosine-type recombinase/integrase [Enterococcus avium]
MASFQSYTTKSGKKLWSVKAYLGIDPATNKQVNLQKKGFSNKKEAQLFYNRKIVEIEKNGFKKQRADTFKEVYELWLETTYKLMVKESSYNRLKLQFNKHILPAFGNQSIKTIQPVDLQRYANEKSNEVQEYRLQLSNISQIFEFAIKQGIITSNPIRMITIPKKKANLEKKKIKYFTKDELKILLADAKENEPYKIFAFLYLMANTGCRKGEIMGLQWDCIDFENKTLEIHQTLARGENRRLYLEEPKTVHSFRTIPLGDETISILKMWRKVQRETMLQVGINTMSTKQLVFSSPFNEFINMDIPNRWMARICKRTNIPILTPHSLRHTFSTLLISEGVNPKTVSELLGHSSVSFTLDIYTGVFDTEKTSTIKLLAGIIN